MNRKASGHTPEAFLFGVLANDSPCVPPAGNSTIRPPRSATRRGAPYGPPMSSLPGGCAVDCHRDHRADRASRGRCHRSLRRRRGALFGAALGVGGRGIPALVKEHPDDPQSIKSLFFLGEALVQLGKYDDARAEFQRFLARDPDSAYAAQALFRSGESAFLAGNRAAARETLEQFCKQHPDDKLKSFALMYLGENCRDREAVDRSGKNVCRSAGIKARSAARRESSLFAWRRPVSIRRFHGGDRHA